MKKSLFLVLLLTLMVGLLPPQAQAFELGTVFSSISNSFKQRMQRVYLALPGNKSGIAVVQQSYLAMNQLETVQSDTKLTAVMQKEDKDLLTVDFSVAGPVKVGDVYDPATYQQDMKMVGTLVVEGTTLTADADLKLDGKTVYIKFNQMPAMPFLPGSNVKDQWLKMDTKAAKEDGVMMEEDSDETEMMAVTPTDEQKQQLQELYMQFAQNIELSEARRETVDGVKAFVVDATVKPEDIKMVMTKAAQIEGRSEAEIAEMTVSLDKALALMSEVKAVIVIDRSSFYLTKLEVPLQFDLSKVDTSTAAELNAQVVPLGDAADADTLKVNAVFMFSKFNQPVEFTIPTDARDAAEVFAEAIGGAMGADQGRGVGSGAMMVPPSAMQNSRRPVELPTLSAEEEAMLKQYGIDPKELR